MAQLMLPAREQAEESLRGGRKGIVDSWAIIDGVMGRDCEPRVALCDRHDLLPAPGYNPISVLMTTLVQTP
ncbi:unnamed protein product [Leptosia nina]|uniref:Uncharacterized protein n=1 Tax=Leptosia nina TaxID=320188 RepID=A0AAV1JSF3_9NEOP